MHVFWIPMQVTPLHTDPHPNLLCQAAGRKYVRLYSPAHTEGAPGAAVPAAAAARCWRRMVVALLLCLLPACKPQWFAAPAPERLAGGQDETNPAPPCLPVQPCTRTQRACTPTPARWVCWLLCAVLLTQNSMAGGLKLV